MAVKDDFRFNVDSKFCFYCLSFLCPKNVSYVANYVFMWLLATSLKGGFCFELTYITDNITTL